MKVHINQRRAETVIKRSGHRVRVYGGLIQMAKGAPVISIPDLATGYPGAQGKQISEIADRKVRESSHNWKVAIHPTTAQGTLPEVAMLDVKGNIEKLTEEANKAIMKEFEIASLTFDEQEDSHEKDRPIAMAWMAYLNTGVTSYSEKRDDAVRQFLIEGYHDINKCEEAIYEIEKQMDGKLDTI